MTLRITVLLAILFLQVSCGGGSGETTNTNSDNAEQDGSGESVTSGLNSDSGGPIDSAEVSAPLSIRGMRLQMMVENGSGVFAVRGSFIITFAEFSDNYSLAGDSVNVVNSSGSYTYAAENNIGTITFSDSAVSGGTFILNYTTSEGGRFEVTANSDTSSFQLGDFVELE